MPLRSDWSNDRCSIARALEVIGDPWAMVVLRGAFQGVRRYEEFRRRSGAADNVLSKRLKDLVEAGLLRRSPYQDDGRTRHEYLLTQSGADLLPILNGLLLWGERYRPHDDPSVHMQIVHRGCGAVTDTVERCRNCGAMMRPEDIAWRKSWEPADVPLVGAPTAADIG